VNPHGELREQYADFARHARHDSPCFAAWAEGVLDDPEVLVWLADLPPLKQQPNLVFAAARWHGVAAPGPYAGLRAALLGDDGSIRATIAARSTQTNEAGRLATLTPALAGLADGRPLALLEVGASAGLCLYPDRWSYRWHVRDRPDRPVTAGAGPLLECRVTGPFPDRVDVPAVAWRRGVDLHPLDVTDADQMAWLETLVWPEHDGRRERLRRAVGIARAEPPVLEAGDLLTEVPRRVEEAAGRGPVVVFHSAVLAYLEDADRERFHDLMTDLVVQGRCHWISNEGRRVLPRITGDLEVPRGRFVTALDGVPVAWSHGHGHAIDWR